MTGRRPGGAAPPTGPYLGFDPQHAHIIAYAEVIMDFVAAGPVRGVLAGGLPEDLKDRHAFRFGGSNNQNID